MKYLTSAQIKDKVKGPRSALRVSIQHWGQMARMPEVDFRHEADISSPMCGLCTLYYSEDTEVCDNNCPLKEDNCCTKSASSYREVSKAWLNHNYPAFIAASKKMVEVLESLL